MEAPAKASAGIAAVDAPGKPVPPVQQIADSIPVGTEKRKRGRPPKARPGPVQGSGAPAGMEASEADLAATAPAVDVALVKKTVESVIGAIDGAIMRKVYSTHFRVSKDEAGAKELAITAGMTKDELAVISECTGVVCQKYNLLGQYAPEAMLLAVATGYSLRVIFVFRKLNVIIEQQAATLHKLNAAKPPAN
jgi:hypothetical protein